MAEILCILWLIATLIFMLLLVFFSLIKSTHDQVRLIYGHLLLLSLSFLSFLLGLSGQPLWMLLKHSQQPTKQSKHNNPTFASCPSGCKYWTMQSLK